MNKYFRLLICVVMIMALLPTLTASAALPTNMSWVKYSGNPVATTSTCPALGIAFRPSIVIESSSNYKMYFGTPYDGADVYLATTADGGQSWTCANGGSPVLTRGTSGQWDDTRVNMVSVIKDGGTYKMWYSGRNSTAHWAIGYATSTNGTTWTKYGSNPVLTVGGFSAWDSQYVREPSVLLIGSTYHMWYAGTSNFPYFHIGHATSTDGTTWIKDGSNPIISSVPGRWDANEQYSPSVVFNAVDSNYEMFYSGENGNRWVTGHATAASANGPWTTDTNAILAPSGGWESSDSLDYAGAVLDGSTWKVFYSAGSYQIGLATLTNQAQLTFNPLATSVAIGSPVVVNIDLNAVSNMYGYQFKVNYDSTKLTATSFVFINSFFNTTIDASLVGPTCAAGVCSFAASKVAPGIAVTGTGTIAQITFTGAAADTVPLTFSSDILADKDANVIAHSVNTGWITVYGTATVSGIVTMQGRTTPISAGTVTLYDENGIYAPMPVPFNAVSGAWTATVPAGTTYDLVAAHGLYLSNRLNGVSVVTGGSYPQATTRLLGGDANNDGTISIADLTLIGGAFGNTVTPETSGDITGDGVVNILDLVLAGGNYNLSTPQPW